MMCCATANGPASCSRRPRLAAASSSKAAGRWCATAQASRAASCRSIPTSPIAASSSSSSIARSASKASAPSPAASPTTSTTCWRRSCSAWACCKERLTDDDSREILATITTSAQARRRDGVAGAVVCARAGRQARRDQASADLIADVVRIARDTFPKNIEIVTELEPQLPLIIGDPTQCHQVLLNLCVNAPRRHAGRRAAADARPAHRAPAAALRRDSRRRHRPRHSAEPASTRSSIRSSPPRKPGRAPASACRRRRPSSAATAAGSRSLSEPPHGARFEIYLPVAPVSATRGDSGEMAATPRGSGQTILVVDDEPSVRLVMRTALERAGYQVLPAANGREAIDVFKRPARRIDRRGDHRHDDAGDGRRAGDAGAGEDQSRHPHHRRERHPRQRRRPHERSAGRCGSFSPSRSVPTSCCARWDA